MPKKIEKKDVFEKKSYKNILYLLSFIPEGLRSQEILSTLANDKTLFDLYKKKKIKYDYKRERDKVKEKIKQNGKDRFFNVIERGHITSPQILSNKISTLVDIGAVKRKNSKIILLDDFFREFVVIDYMNELQTYASSQKRKSDRQELKQKENKVIDSYSKIFNDLSQMEKQNVKQHLNDMKASLNEIKKIRLTKFFKKTWAENLKEFYLNTKSETIKKAIKDDPYCFFTIINDILLFNKNKNLTKSDFYFSSGLYLFFLNIEILTTPKSLKKEIQEKFEKSQQDENIISKIPELPSIPKPIYDELLYMLNKIEFGEFYDIKRFSEVWSRIFFRKDFGLKINEIQEIVDWCCEKINVVKDLYKSISIPGKCEGYINDMLMGVSDELPFKPLIFK